MDLPNEQESRAVLLRAYPEPAVTDVERAWSNIELLRRQRPQRMSNGPWGLLVKTAAVIALLATGAVGGMVLRSSGEPAGTLFPFQEPLLSAAPASVPTIVPFGPRVLRVRHWQVSLDNPPMLMEDRSLPLAAGADVSIRRGHLMSRPDIIMPRFDLDLVLRGIPLGSSNGPLDNTLMVAAEISTEYPALDHDARRMGGRFSGSRISGFTAVRHDQSAWIYPFGPPRAEGSAMALEVWLEREGYAGRDSIRPRAASWYEPLAIESAPRVQGARMRIDLIDSLGNSRTVSDSNDLWLTRASGRVFVGGPYPRGHIDVTMVPPPLGQNGPLCFTWKWGDRQPPASYWCFRSDSPEVVLPLYGSAGMQLRVTLIRRLERLPF